MRPCDKTSEDPAKHNGPFQCGGVGNYKDGKKVAVERCQACDNIVLRVLPPSGAYVATKPLLGSRPKPGNAIVLCAYCEKEMEIPPVYRDLGGIPIDCPHCGKTLHFVPIEYKACGEKIVPASWTTHILSPSRGDNATALRPCLVQARLDQAGLGQRSPNIRRIPQSKRQAHCCSRIAPSGCAESPRLAKQWPAPSLDRLGLCSEPSFLRHEFEASGK